MSAFSSPTRLKDKRLEKRGTLPWNKNEVKTQKRHEKDVRSLQRIVRPKENIHFAQGPFSSRSCQLCSRPGQQTNRGFVDMSTGMSTAFYCANGRAYVWVICPVATSFATLQHFLCARGSVRAGQPEQPLRMVALLQHHTVYC